MLKWCASKNASLWSKRRLDPVLVNWFHCVVKNDTIIFPERFYEFMFSNAHNLPKMILTTSPHLHWYKLTPQDTMTICIPENFLGAGLVFNWFLSSGKCIEGVLLLICEVNLGFVQVLHFSLDASRRIRKEWWQCSRGQIGNQTAALHGSDLSPHHALCNLVSNEQSLISYDLSLFKNIVY